MHIGPNSITERSRETKIGTEVAYVTRDTDTTFKVRRSKVKLFDGKNRPSLRPYSAVLCFARHKLAKIAQCFFLMLLLLLLFVCFSEFNGKL